ncbi:MAG: indole-3-glycerol phosphate synthase TrpC [Acidobacteria bacterium]|nr:indole-3-glycerol phosphate synthase TrpC [Acidobacteriota bacterium]
MIDTVPDILARIVAKKRLELDSIRTRRSQLEAAARAKRKSRRDFRAALERTAPAVIAEIKKHSPSRGALTANFDPAGLASSYERGGAAALSVLTDKAFFQGSLEDLSRAREAGSLPVLRKDFTLDELHVIQAAAGGADAILLIAAVLDAPQISSLAVLAREFGMAALVEVHDERELDKALAADADLIGVNNRDLNTFEVTLENSLRLAPRIPAEVLKVSESGVHSAGDIRQLREAGYDAFLVGEHLMRSADPEGALRALLAG